jgi:hypothetical protein
MVMCPVGALAAVAASNPSRQSLACARPGASLGSQRSSQVYVERIVACAAGVRVPRSGCSCEVLAARDRDARRFRSGAADRGRGARSAARRARQGHRCRSVLQSRSQSARPTQRRHRGRGGRPNDTGGKFTPSSEQAGWSCLGRCRREHVEALARLERQRARGDQRPIFGLAPRLVFQRLVISRLPGYRIYDCVRPVRAIPITQLTLRASLVSHAAPPDGLPQSADARSLWTPVYFLVRLSWVSSAPFGSCRFGDDLFERAALPRHRGRARESDES